MFVELGATGSTGCSRDWGGRTQEPGRWPRVPAV